jgi:hypothetical protein
MTERSRQFYDLDGLYMGEDEEIRMGEEDGDNGGYGEGEIEGVTKGGKGGGYEVDIVGMGWADEGEIYGVGGRGGRYVNEDEDEDDPFWA